MRKTKLLLASLLLSQLALAQDGKLLLSLGAGYTGVSSDNQKNNSIGNGYNFQGDAYLPFYRKGWDGTVKGNSFSIGLNIGANVGVIKNIAPSDNDVANNYKVYNGTNTVSTSDDRAMSNNFSGLAGVQAIFGLGKMCIAPVISAGYVHMNLQGFTQTANVSVNGQTQQGDLITKPDNSVSGFLFKPQVKVYYSLNQTVSLFGNVAMIAGPKVNSVTRYLVPQGGFNDAKTYEVKQLAMGTYESKTSTSRYSATEINIGISFAVGKTKPIKKPTGAASASYAKTVQVNPGTDPADSTASARLSMTPTTTRQTQGQNFGEKVSGGLAAVAGQPIGGIVVKGGKNPGGNLINLVSNENGEVVFTANEAGTYTFQITMPNEGDSITIGSPAARRRVEVLKSNVTGDPNPKKNKREKRTYTGGRKNEAPSQLLAAPGNPIGGIIVKGGKNPGGSFITMQTNENGEVNIPVSEAGEYKLILEQPVTDAPAQKTKKVKERPSHGLKDTLKTNV